MPFRSEAQRKKFQALVAEGKMTAEAYEKWEKETPEGKLPERLHPAKKIDPAHHTDPGKRLRSSLGSMLPSYTKKRFGLA